jgi:beta-glucosidase
VSLPRAVGQVPVFYNHKPSGGRTNWRGDYFDAPTSPLYPFGHGLSYTAFDYGALAIVGPASVAEPVEVGVAVTNAGPRRGTEVVQLYLYDRVASVSRPVQQLAGFARVGLDPGESVTVTFSVDLAHLAFLDSRMDWVVEAGEIDVMVGSSSADIRSRGRFTVVDRRFERRPRPVPTKVVTSR